MASIKIDAKGTYINYNAEDINYANSNLLYIGSKENEKTLNTSGTQTILQFDVEKLKTKKIGGTTGIALYKKSSYVDAYDVEKTKSIYCRIGVYGSNTDIVSSITYKNQYTYISNYLEEIKDFWEIEPSYKAYGDSTEPQIVTCYEKDVLDLVDQAIRAGYKYVILWLIYGYSKGSGSTDYYYYSTIYNNSNYITVSYDDVVPVIESIYPQNINVENTKDVTFTWSYSAVGTFGIRKQSLYELQWSYDQSDWNTISKNTEDQYCTVPKNTFAVGKTVYWRVRATSIDNLTSAWSQTLSIKVIGETGAPEITNVTMDAKPTITWEVEEQAGYELKIISNTTRKTVYQTGLVTTAETQVKLNKMFAEDNYTVSMRVLNNFGYYTAWASYNWVLVYESRATVPETPVVNVITGHFIEIITFDSLTAGDDKYYVVRTDEDGNEAIVDIHNDNDTIDTKCALNKVYYYKIRHFNENTSGFSDSESVITYVEAQGAIVNTIGTNPKSYQLWSNEDEGLFEIEKADTAEKTFHWLLGRKYPVMETSDWYTISRSLKAYISQKEYNELLQIVDDNEAVYYRSDGEAFLANMEMSYGSKYLDGGIIASFTFTRIDEDEVDLES